MGLKIVSGGTTDAADGTLVTSGSKFVFAALDGVVDLHVRCDDDTYSSDSTLTVPSDGDFEVSFDGGSVWKDSADNPIPIATTIGLGGTDLGDLNFPIKVRQHALTATVSGQISSDGSYSACTALADVTGFTVAPGNAYNTLSWAAVTSRTSYRIDRATDAGFTTGVALDLSPGLTATTYVDTGRTNGTTYYYRIKAVGAYRFKDSASYATGNAAPFAFNDTFSGSAANLAASGHVADTGQAWVALTGGTTSVMRVDGAGKAVATTGAGISASLVATALGDDIILEGGLSLDAGAVGDLVGFMARAPNGSPAGGDYLHPYLYHDTGGVKLGFTNGTTTYFFDLVATVLGAYTAATVYTVRLELSGTAAVLKINGTTAWSGTVSSSTVGGKVGVRCGDVATGKVDFLRSA